MIEHSMSKRDFLVRPWVSPKTLSNEQFMRIYTMYAKEKYPGHKGIVTTGWATDNPTLSVVIN